MENVKYLNACDKWEDEVTNAWNDTDFINKDLWDAKEYSNIEPKIIKLKSKLNGMTQIIIHHGLTYIV